MKQEEKLKIAKAFRMAQDRIRSKKNFFICVALSQSYTAGRHAAAKIICDRMRTPAGQAWSLETWLHERHGICQQDLIAEHMHPYRIAWLEALIKEHDPEGVTA